MHNLIARIIAALLWLEKRLKPLAKTPLGRAGIFAFVSVFMLSRAHTALAAEPPEPGLIESAMFWIASIGLSIAVILSKLVVAVLEVMIPVMMYNKFTSSPVVTAGWAIVRDTVNMFFVIILLVIAFGTIFGYKKYTWQQQIPKLMVFAILINFSKTICGLVIDIGQVVMLTFTNAIREIAAGNIVQMLGIGDIYSLSPNAAAFQNATGLQPFDLLASSLISVIMMFFILATMLMLLGILIYRIVMLWVLIVLAPLTWFVAGTGGVLNEKSYTTWKSKFVCLVAIGPVLMFFLWLTLVVMGAGDIAETAQFTVDGQTNPVGGFITKIMELNRLISFVISMAMLYAGFEAASGVCGSAGLGFISNQLKGGPTGNGGVRAAKVVAGMGARVGAKGVRVGASAVRTGFNNSVVPLAQYTAGKIDNSQRLQNSDGRLASAIKATTSKGREGLYRNIAKGAGTGIVGQTLARGATAQADKLSSGRAAKLASGLNAYKGDSGDSKNATLKRMAQNGAITPNGKNEERALLLDAMTDPDRMKDLQASGALETLWKRHGKEIEAESKGDKGLSTRVSTFKKANADVAGSWGDIKDAKDAKSMSLFALAAAKSAKDKDPADDKLNMKSGIQKTKKEGGGEYTVAEALAARKFGTKEQQDAYIEGTGAIYGGMKPEELVRIPPKALAENLTDKVADKSVMINGKSITIGQQLLASQDAGTQAALHTRINDPKQAGLREGMLKQIGVEGGKVTGKENGAKFLSSMTTNPTAISYLDDQTFKDLDDEQLVDLGSAFADPKLLKSVLMNYRKDPNAESSKQALSRIQSILQKNSTQENTDALRYIEEQKKAIADGSRLQNMTAAVKAAPGQVRARVNATIDTAAITSVVDDLDQQSDLEQKITESEELIRNTAPTDPKLQSISKKDADLNAQFDAVKASINERVENIAASDALSQKLEDEIAKQADALINMQGVVAQDRAKNAFVRENDAKLAAEQKRLAQLNGLKTRVEAVKQKNTPAAPPTPPVTP